MSNNIAFQSVKRLKSMLQRRQVTPAELVDTFAKRIDQHNARAKAFITTTIDAAREQALHISQGDLDSSPFAGIPYCSKDLFDVRGVLTSAGSRVFHDRIAKTDAYAIAKLRSARAISLGKTNLHEFAYGATGENEVYGTAVNAYDSSSGSAAAVAYSRTVSLTVQMPEALSAHSAYLQDRGELYGADFRAGLALGQCILAEHYVKAKRFVEIYRQQTNSLFSEVDLILTPATPEIAQKVGTIKVTRDGFNEAIGNAITRFTTFFNMTGHPALTMPCAMHTEGLPIALQLVGRYFDEKLVLRAAHAIAQSNRFSIPLPKVDF